jgi:hypothetical protein
VQFVERARGLTFKHPIYVDFMSDADFRNQVDPAGGSESSGDNEASNIAASELRAMGLLDGGIDPASQTDAFRGDDVVGFYSFETKRIAVRGQTLSLAATSTLVHELTHALQDQYFDITSQVSQIDPADVDASDAFRDLLEGDAVRIEDEYVASLSKADQAKERAEETALAGPAAADSKSIPQIVEATELAPYALGPYFARFLVDAHTSAGINGFFEAPPTAQMQVMQPWRFIGGQSEYSVQNDESSPGTEFDHGNLGALDWYLLLADKLGPSAAMRAVEGWNGDNYVAYRIGSQSCLQLSYEADSKASQNVTAAALNQWAKAVPGHDVKIDVEGNEATGITVRTCDPGAKAQHVVKGQIINALRVAEARLGIADELLTSGATPKQAGCTATKVAERLTLAQLEATKATAADKAELKAAQKACR